MATDDLRLRDASAVLAKAADENFPVAPFFLPRAWRDDLMAVYGVVRLIDDTGDGDLDPAAGHAAHLGVDPDAAGDPLRMLDAVEADLREVFGGGDAGHPLVRSLAAPAARGTLTLDPFLDLIAANRQDQHVGRYETYDDLVAYCALSANPIGRLVLAITGTETPERVRRSDAVCTALQIVEHIQDVAEDLRRDRIYLPIEDMKRFHVSEPDLAAPTAGASVRALVAYETERARRLLNEGTPLVGSVHGRLKLLLAGFVAGGRAAVRAIVASGYDVLPGPPKPTKPRLLREAGAVLRGEG
ncbi:squalene synthase HpnC [Streptomyces alfalfae]|uniref:Squalene synthase HpnC n=1 Tax=Streptomyces alfalfae TaxID=1642299 RepID=A0ABN4VJA1_9ACTN|nr:squalene synthase HpnC [Streptomyces alfalfae]AYA15535.1 squalene synthase HpnC [Streptomyces fradiae]APY85190.1 squalene synthase HpnC [Streptomyces alfalfae]QUI35004.1 squalene synthase HpnC [Streptomyces alfalfae]RXX39011.1 squalene synthase HpnC [Streptomyces alfalfae]RZM85656.1 squalene synthase HpnC [Streptomyces alfalfae]